MIDPADWKAYQGRILRALRDAELSGQDQEAAARAAVSLVPRDFALLVSDLSDRRLVKARNVEVAEVAGPIDVRIDGLTPLGRDQVDDPESGLAAQPVEILPAEVGRIEETVHLVIRAIQAAEAGEPGETRKGEQG